MTILTKPISGEKKDKLAPLVQNDQLASAVSKPFFSSKITDVSVKWPTLLFSKVNLLFNIFIIVQIISCTIIVNVKTSTVLTIK